MFSHQFLLDTLMRLPNLMHVLINLILAAKFIILHYSSAIVPSAEANVGGNQTNSRENIEFNVNKTPK